MHLNSQCATVNALRQWYETTTGRTHSPVLSPPMTPWHHMKNQKTHCLFQPPLTACHCNTTWLSRTNTAAVAVASPGAAVAVCYIASVAQLAQLPNPAAAHAAHAAAVTTATAAGGGAAATTAAYYCHCNSAVVLCLPVLPYLLSAAT